MNPKVFTNVLLLGFIVCFTGSSLSASPELPETPEEIRDTWGSVLYCQAIYKEPSVQGRIYPADTQACSQSDRLMRDIVRKYAPDDQQTLEMEAMKKSRIIRYNTRDVQEAVRACREQCGELAMQLQSHASD